MAVLNRNLITKGIFAVSVVAITAIVGSVGFARAQQGGQVLGDGYGGTGALIRAALAQFESAVSAAQSKYRADVNACLAQYSPAGNHDDFNRRNSDAIDNLRTFATNPARTNENDQQLDRLLTAQELQAKASLTANTNQMVAGLAQAQRLQNAQALQQCLRTASNTFQASLQSAHKTLIQTLHDILHRRS